MLGMIFSDPRKRGEIREARLVASGDASEARPRAVSDVVVVRKRSEQREGKGNKGFGFCAIGTARTAKKKVTDAVFNRNREPPQGTSRMRRSQSGQTRGGRWKEAAVEMLICVVFLSLRCFGKWRFSAPIHFRC